MQEGVEIAEAENIRVGRVTKGTQALRLEGLRFVGEHGLKRTQMLIVELEFRGKSFSSMELIPPYSLDWNPKTGDWQGRASAENIGPWYDQAKWDILYAWARGQTEGFTWQDTKPRNKKSYLKACLFWSGISPNTYSGRTLQIDGSIVHSVQDLFCHLGEVFHGFGGYMGQDLHGLNDCLNELGDTRSVPGYNLVTIHHTAHLRQVLDPQGTRKRNELSYFACLVKVFEDGGMEVRLQE